MSTKGKLSIAETFLNEVIEPTKAQALNRGMGAAPADKSGWVLTHLLRIPNTKNFKPRGHFTEHQHTSP